MKTNNNHSTPAPAVMFQQAMRGALHRAQHHTECTVVYNEKTDRFDCVLPGNYKDPAAIAIIVVTQAWGQEHGYYTEAGKVNEQAVEDNFYQCVVDHLIASAQREDTPRIRHMITLFRGKYVRSIYVDINEKVKGYGEIGSRRLRELLYLPTYRDLDKDVARCGLTVDQLKMIIHPLNEDVQNAIGDK